MTKAAGGHILTAIIAPKAVPVSVRVRIRVRVPILLGQPLTEAIHMGRMVVLNHRPIDRVRGTVRVRITGARSPIVMRGVMQLRIQGKGHEHPLVPWQA